MKAVLVGLKPTSKEDFKIFTGRHGIKGRRALQDVKNAVYFAGTRLGVGDQGPVKAVGVVAGKESARLG